LSSTEHLPAGIDDPRALEAASSGPLGTDTEHNLEDTLRNPFRSGGLTTADVGAPSGAAQRWGRTHDQLIAGVLAVLVAFGLWQLSSLFLKPIFISTPSRVIPAFFTLIGSGPLPHAFLTSLEEMIIGVVIAAVVGIGIGLLMGRVRMVERALEPLVAFGNATPSIALLPVMEVWFGFGTTARVAFIMVIAVWPLVVNTHAGVRAVRGRLADVGTTFGMSGLQQIRYVYLPGTMPFIFVGARIALAVGAVGMILGGQEIGQTGLGGLTSDFGSYGETPQLIATIATTTILAILLFWALRQVQARAFPWIAATSAGRRDAR
jgi:ABC-type nitrate/sulfonate/bicarbonate transport system permease component